jgi:hypothetical protein
MKVTSLKDLARRPPREIPLASLPREVLITDYARAKALAVSELVRRVHGEALEWYAFTLGERSRPELIVDIGLPVQAENQENYVSLSPEGIARFQETLPAARLVNGWLHSHGALEFRGFSGTDAANQATVLDYVTSLLMFPVAKKEVVIRDLTLVAAPDREPPPEELAPGSVTLVTEVPVAQVRIFETVAGGFCHAIVIGDEGWSRQEIHYKTRGVLTGETQVSRREADLVVVASGRRLTASELEALEAQVRDHLRPVTYIPEKLERA